jgi:hypothetical protein
MLSEKEIVKKLIGSYPNCIETIAIYGASTPGVDFVSTVDNFAERIIKDFDKNRQKYYFGVMFENQQDCARYLASYMHDLYEECQNFVDENYYTENGEIYYYDEEED